MLRFMKAKSQDGGGARNAESTSRSQLFMKSSNTVKMATIVTVFKSDCVMLIKIGDKHFMSRQFTLDEEPCQNCNKLIYDVPLRLFGGKHGGFCFCVKCAKELEIFDSLIPVVEPKGEPIEP